jgi:oligopeptide transport system permease protein
MYKYLARRVLLGVFTVLAVSFIVFLLIHIFPGSPFITERRYDAETMAILNARYNLDKPLLVQYALWLGGALHGDLGTSLRFRNLEVADIISQRFAVSLQLGLAALVVTVVLGVGLGLLAALRQNTRMDYAAMFLSTVGYSVPNFVVGTLLILVLGKQLYNFTGGVFYYEVGWGSPVQILVPALALGLPPASYVARITRASMLEVIRQDYIRTARSKGIPNRQVITRHVIKNGLIPVITILGILVTALITGSTVIEFLFGVPGIGQYFVTAVLASDYTMVLGLFVFFTVLIVAANLTVDVLYGFLDPRIKYA